jgi:hypothetical protein
MGCNEIIGDVVKMRECYLFGGDSGDDLSKPKPGTDYFREAPGISNDFSHKNLCTLGHPCTAYIKMHLCSQDLIHTATGQAHLVLRTPILAGQRLICNTGFAGRREEAPGLRFSVVPSDMFKLYER